MSSVMVNGFPEDVLMDIFARLPVKSLSQFKRVCKSWCNLIKDPVFVTKYVNQFALSNNGKASFRIKLPKPDDLVDQHIEGIFALTGLGFGYDPESNDYKLVRFSYSKELEDQSYSEVDGYSLSTNSWRRKDMLVPGVVFENSFSKAVINVALHWRGIAKKRGFYSFLILSFVISSTNYQEYRNTFNIWEYRNTFDIWVMNEYGVEESWTKQSTVGPLGVHSLVGFGKNEELLFASHSMMLLYDLQRVKTPHDDISWANIIGDNFIRCIEAANHIESLVTIEGPKLVCPAHIRKEASQVFSFVLSSKEASLTLLKKCRIVIVVQDEGLLEVSNMN
ncbi:hypothetical protein SO802_031488 [Lithocarpus litseifolius]|uniref:F-box domain-containing protein n=1 Tax=Lithocarpus litseifolius TaxID=425828 RepID=A0AAW2BN16_9ROSI